MITFTTLDKWRKLEKRARQECTGCQYMRIIRTNLESKHSSLSCWMNHSLLECFQFNNLFYFPSYSQRMFQENNGDAWKEKKFCQKTSHSIYFNSRTFSIFSRHAYWNRPLKVIEKISSFISASLICVFWVLCWFVKTSSSFLS